MKTFIASFGEFLRFENYGALGIPLIPILVSISAGFVTLFWFGIAVPGYLWALACLGAGSLIGIIFGIPRSASRSPEQGKTGLAELRANTNMEEISDWLTKLLVGAGLVELKELPQAIDSAARYIAPALQSRAGMPPTTLMSIAAAILIYFSVEGFISGYIFARVYFTLVLDLANRQLNKHDADS